MCCAESCTGIEQNFNTVNLYDTSGEVMVGFALPLMIFCLLKP
jgi:hypothetical protein